MLAPLSWLKDYVKITLPTKQLGERLTEVGLSTEKITSVDNDTVFEFEITPNRPDLLSIIGIAREIAAIEKTNIHFPKSTIDVARIKPKKTLSLTIKTDPTINPRFTGIIIDGIKVEESPEWLKERLVKIGQRTINNIVDITNYVMFELGNPIHAFDYDKIAGNIMRVRLAREGESFKSVDGISYHLPKDAVIIEDEEKIIDLCGIKGGYNSGTFENTKTIFIRVPVEIPQLIRRASQRLSLRSEASSIFERGVNTGGTIEALNRCVDLILEIAGGEVASSLYDLKKNDFKPWTLALRLDRLHRVLGIEIETSDIIKILKTLELNPQRQNNTIQVTVPTYRNDLKLEEDLIEEVARIYGYNNFPKTLPIGSVPVKQIPYFKDYRFDEKAKQILQGGGFSEIYTYSLISEKDLKENNINSEKILRIDTPISKEYEYLRPTLSINLIKALKQNTSYFDRVELFELGKIYQDTTEDEKREVYMLAGISNIKNFLELKGILQRLFDEYNISDDPTQFIMQKQEGVLFEIPLTLLFKHIGKHKKYNPVAKYPPVIEDLSLVIPGKIPIGDIIKTIEKQSNIIQSVTLLDTYGNTKTFHIIFQHAEKNLTNQEVGVVRKKILESLKEKWDITQKE